LDLNFAGLDNVNNFTGYTWDVTLELYFAQNRFYDPEIRRFTQEDYAKDGGNWYVYCGDNPITRTDMTGLYYILKLKDGTFEARKQGEVDAVLQGIIPGVSIQNAWGIIFNGNEIVGGNSRKDADIDGYIIDAALNDATAYINEVIVPYISNSGGVVGQFAGLAISVAANFGSSIISAFKSIPANWKIANRDDVIWMVFDHAGIKPRDCYSKVTLEKEMQKVDAFVQRAYKYFTTKLEDINATMYNAGRAFATGDSKTINKMVKQLGNTYYSEIVYIVAERYFGHMYCGTVLRLSSYTVWDSYSNVHETSSTIFVQLKDEYFNQLKTVYEDVIKYFQSAFPSSYSR
jgi:RHS repeat-associated protein